jgi:hypothetical protein
MDRPSVGTVTALRRANDPRLCRLPEAKILEIPQGHLVTRPGIRPAQTKIVRQDHRERARAAWLSSAARFPAIACQVIFLFLGRYARRRTRYTEGWLYQATARSTPVSSCAWGAAEVRAERSPCSSAQPQRSQSAPGPVPDWPRELVHLPSAPTRRRRRPERRPQRVAAAGGPADEIRDRAALPGSLAAVTRRECLRVLRPAHAALINADSSAAGGCDTEAASVRSRPPLRQSR